MAPKRVALKSIQSLTFYKDQVTIARRTSPIPQLQCNGKPCRSFQPDVVQCVNMGDDGSGGVQWKCETDLPRTIRLGKVHVSCEGWSRAGDPYVLQGSCGLEYDLHTVNRGLEYGEDPSIGYRSHRSSSSSSFNLIDSLFYILYLGVAFIITYSLIRSCIRRTIPRYTPPPLSRFWPGGGGGGGWGGGGGGPGFGGGQAPPPPPPYSKYGTESGTAGLGTGSGNGLGGFWTGLAAGAAGSLLVNRLTRSNDNQPEPPVAVLPPRRGYVYERPVDRWDDRGEGSSTGLRRATGFGGSSTR